MTDKSKKKGFGSNPEAINRGGRPVGSKSKNTLDQAIKRFEANQLDAAQVIISIMQGNTKALGVEEIKVGERLNAAKYVIKAPSEIAKDNSKADGTKVEGSSEGSSGGSSDTESSSDTVVPLVQMRYTK